MVVRVLRVVRVVRLNSNGCFNGCFNRMRVLKVVLTAEF